MTKQELIDVIAENNKWGLTKKATAEVVDAVFMGIRKAVKKGRRFSYPGFGTWNVRTRKARNGRNPQTGAPINIAAAKVPSFKAGKALKDAVN